jgi:eukaryotic-like serine/threonine-protein kinase
VPEKRNLSKFSPPGPGKLPKTRDLQELPELSVGSASGFFGILYPGFVRGQAYVLAHRYSEAAAEFQRVLDYPGVVFADPVGARAHLELGRAYALSGDKVKAKAAYQDFLTLWKDADPDIPILREA